MEKCSLNFTVKVREDSATRVYPTKLQEIGVEQRRGAFEACIATIAALNKRIEEHLEVIQVNTVAHIHFQKWVYSFAFSAILRDPFGSSEKLKAELTTEISLSVFDALSFGSGIQVVLDGRIKEVLRTRQCGVNGIVDEFEQILNT